MSSGRLFGTDGVRGIANGDLTPEFTLALCAAAARALLKRHPATDESPRVVIGRDPRRSGDLLCAAATAGFLAEGVDVIDIGVVPTPAVALATRSVGAIAGIVISASHNPMPDNGVKFFGPDARKLADSVEDEIEHEWKVGTTGHRPTGARVGRRTERPDLVEEYADFLARSLAPYDLRGLTILIDSAHGAASFLAAPLLSRLGAKVISRNDSPNGLNINDRVGSLYASTMAAETLAAGADVGLAFDGDADRVILADAKGRVFDGDRILCALGLHLQKRGKLNNGVVVGTVMSNLGLEEAFGNVGIKLVRARVGDRYVSEQIEKNAASIGGEQSGHILFPEISPAGDGLLTALQVLKVVRESGRTLSDWHDSMRTFPQKLVNVYVTERENWEGDPIIVSAIDIASARLGDSGRLLVRPSGTEKMIRVMAEAPTQAMVEEACDLVAEAIRLSRGTLEDV